MFFYKIKKQLKSTRINLLNLWNELWEWDYPIQNKFKKLQSLALNQLIVEGQRSEKKRFKKKRKNLSHLELT